MGEFEKLLDDYTTDEDLGLSQVEKGETQKSAGLIDGHVHSRGSFDGMEKPSKLVKMAKASGVKYMAITDHNTTSAIAEYFMERGCDPNDVYAEIDGVKVIAGTEITCKLGVPNVKGNDMKLHLLVYGAKMQGSPLARLLQIKAANDFAFDFGMPIHCLKKMGLITNPQQEKEWKNKLKAFIIDERKARPGVNEMTREMTMRFLDQQGMNISKSHRELCEMLSDYNTVARLNLKVEDVIECAHASGGICVLAHPYVNLVRTIQPNREKAIRILLNMGLDGFEMMCNSSDSACNDMIRTIASKYKGGKTGKKSKKIIYTGGSDFHNTLNSKIGYIQYKDPISCASFRGFIEAIERLKAERTLEDTSLKPNSERIERIIKHYIDENELCITGSVSTETMEAMKAFKKERKAANNKLGMGKAQVKKGRKKQRTKMKEKGQVYYGEPKGKNKSGYTM